MEENIYEIYWNGPYSSVDEINEKVDSKDADKYVLYKIYGSHPIYGRNVLLYIGKTTRGAGKRLKEHRYWSEADQYGEAKIYIASLGKFENWENSASIHLFPKPEEQILLNLESLLIYTHQPAFNQMNKKTAKNSFNLRIFNTGEFGALIPEISSMFQNIEKN